MRACFFGLALVLAAEGQASTTASCRSAEILDGLWQSSFRALSETLGAVDRKEAITLTRLDYDVSILSAISGINADFTCLGYYLPDERLRATMNRWRSWYPGLRKELCRPTENSNRTGTADGWSLRTRGCPGQSRLVELWLENLRQHEGALKDLLHGMELQEPEIDARVGFFTDVTGIPLTSFAPGKVDLGLGYWLSAVDMLWDEWLAAHVGGLCDP